MPDLSVVIKVMSEAVQATLYMTLVTTFMAYLFGVPLGVVLAITPKKGIYPIPWLNAILSFIVNILRSVPFIILLVAILPFTRLIVGVGIGPNAMIVPLVLAAIPFIARLIETTLNEVDPGLIEAAQAMGANVFQIVTKVMLVESLPSLILNAAIATTTILGYGAMAGFVGAGGLGQVIINYGYYRKDMPEMMFIGIILLIIIVQVLQYIGVTAERKVNRKRK